MSSPEKPSGWRAAWPRHLATGLLLVVAAQAGVFAGALGFCVSGAFRWTTALAGVFGNATVGLIVAAVLYALLWRRPVMLAVGLTISFVLHGLVTIACTEFMLERGAPMALFDVPHGWDAGFIGSQLGLLVGPRYGPFLAGAIVLLVAALAGLVRLGRREAERGASTGWQRSGALVVLGLFVALSLWVHRTERGKQALRPYSALLGALVTTNHLNMVVGVEPILLERSVSEADGQSGMAALGLRASPCADGLRVFEPIPIDVPERAVAFQSSLAALAASLRAGEQPLAFTFIMLESVGADDIHGLDGAAPAGLTPYLDALAGGQGTALVGRRFYQAGQRTAAAMSALLCGVGTAPLLLAPLRDLPHLELRCWPDLAQEATVGLRFFYAENLEFDRYRGTLQDHGFGYLHVPQEEGRKRGAWGLSDRELFVDMLADVAATSPPSGEPAGAVVRGALTLSTHGPYRVPEDMPEAAAAEARSLAEGVTDSSTNQARLVTVAYLDRALASFVPALLAAEAKAGRVPVVLLVGDHTSGRPVGRQKLAAARIPVFWIFPPDTDAELLARTQGELDQSAWSQNDLARMILTLLDRTGTLGALPPARRWHSMGGQALSGSFAMPPPHQQTRVWTVDVLARSRFLGGSDEVLLEEGLAPPTTRQDFETPGNTAGAALPGLAWLLGHPDRLGPCPPTP